MLRQLSEICLTPSVAVTDRQKGAEFSADLSRKDWSVIEAWKVRRVLKKANRDYEWAITRGKPEIFSHRYPDIPTIISQRGIREYALNRAIFDLAIASRAKDAATVHLQELAAMPPAAKPDLGNSTKLSPSLSAATLGKCARCHADLINGHKFCGECGCAVRPPQPPPSIPVATMVKCSRCRTDLVSGHKFCTVCGARVQPSSVRSAASLPPKQCQSCHLTNVGTAERCDCGELL
jgi:hypothetical protein